MRGPSKKEQQPREGDRCVSIGEASGTVLRIVEARSGTYATVEWDNGSTGRHTLETLYKTDRPRPQVGDVWSITGGHGLMLIVSVEKDADGHPAVLTMRGHGPQKESANHWFPLSRLGSRATNEVVLREWAEARARKVDCNNPDCWCVARRADVQGRAAMNPHMPWSDS